MDTNYNLSSVLSSALAESKTRRQQWAQHPVAVKYQCGCVSRITCEHPQYANALAYARNYGGSLMHMPNPCLHHAGRKNQKELN
jgi:hypothetical protein